jgi:hypothetical protein
MRPTFQLLNADWNADGTAPDAVAEVAGADLSLTFRVNAVQFPDFDAGEVGTLRFINCRRYRLGPTNDEGWSRGQCRFSGLAPAWGEFYLVKGEAALLNAPRDWKTVDAAPMGPDGHHFLFYFKDKTFECVADKCLVEPVDGNALHRTGKDVRA